MDSKKPNKRTIPNPPEHKPDRRATTPGYTPVGHQEAVSRKLSAGSEQRSVFPKATRKGSDDVVPAESFTSTKVEQPVKLQMGERELGQKPITIMSVLSLKVEKYPERQAYAYKSDDTWQYLTYKGLHQLVQRAAKGFISFGLQRFSGVAIIGHNSPEWAIANLATIYAGGIVVPISAALPVDECCSMIKITRCSIVVIGSSKQLDLVEQIRKQSLHIRAVIKYGNDGGVMTPVRFHTWEKLLAMGDKVENERLSERIRFQAPNLCCTIIYTTGITGPPKPVMLSHDNLVWTARSVGNRMSCNHASGAIVSIITYAHVSGLLFDLYIPLLFATTVYFSPSQSIFERTKEANPTMLLAPYLVFDEVRVQMTAHLNRSFFSRMIYWWAKTVGHRGYEAKIRRRPMPFLWSMANTLVYQKIRTRLGLQYSNEIFTTGRLLSPEAFEFFASLNMPVLGVYGMTESTGPTAAAAIPDMLRIDSAGKAIDGCSTKIANPDVNGVGDLLIRGRNIFMGYLDAPELTNASFDKEGWFIPGDLARRDENGFLYIVGKVAELVTLESGEAIAPEPLESKVREALPFIRNCMLVGKGRAHLAILLTIKTVVNWRTYEISNSLTADSRKWFLKMGYKDESIDRFIQNPDKRIVKKIQDIIDKLNAKAIPSHRLKKWTILPRDFTVQSGEINFSLRIRRSFVENEYAETIDSMYVET